MPSRRRPTPKTLSSRRRPGSAARTPWRERALGIKGIAAVAIAGLLLGGDGGALITAAADDDGDHLREGGHRYGDGRFPNPPEFPGNGEMAPPPPESS